MKIFVSGAGGYIGIPVCHELLRRGHTVIAFDRYFFGLERMAAFNPARSIHTLVGDIRSVEANRIKGCDAVIDLAGLSNDASAEIDPGLTKHINMRGAANLAHRAKEANVRRYVYSSSASVYGHGSGGFCLEETDAVAPLTLYAESKLATERTVLGIEDDGWEPVILRNATVFGLAPRMRFDLVVNIMTLRAWRDKLIYVMGGGDQWRPLIHVSDLATMFVDAVEAPAKKVSRQIINVGAWNYRVRDIATMVTDAIADVRVHKIPDDPDRRSYNVNFGKMRDIFGQQRPMIGPTAAIGEMKGALDAGYLTDDPSCYTLGWYRSMIEWDRRLRELRLDGQLM